MTASHEMISQPSFLLAKCSLGARLWLSRSSPAQRPSEAPTAFHTKFCAPGHSRFSLIGLHPLFPALVATILPLMLQGNSLFSEKNSGENGLTISGSAEARVGEPKSFHAFYPASSHACINDVQHPQFKL